MSTNTTLKASDNVLTVLRQAIIDGDGLTLQGQLDRKDYVAVNKFLETAGINWNKKAKRHLFESQAAAQKLSELLSTGALRDDKKHFQAFYTPEEVADEMALEAGLGSGMSILDPSAGTGRLLLAVRKWRRSTFLTAIEIDESKTELSGIADRVFYGDFLQFDPLVKIGLFDRVILNPPYTAIKGIGPQDIAHTLHACKFLKPDGKIVGLCSAGPKQEQVLRPLAKMWRNLPPGTFAESGTNIATVMFTIEGR